jgi:hypothetical protein
MEEEKRKVTGEEMRKGEQRRANEQRKVKRKLLALFSSSTLVNIFYYTFYTLHSLIITMHHFSLSC